MSFHDANKAVFLQLTVIILSLEESRNRKYGKEIIKRKAELQTTLNFYSCKPIADLIVKGKKLP